VTDELQKHRKISNATARMASASQSSNKEQRGERAVHNDNHFGLCGLGMSTSVSMRLTEGMSVPETADPYGGAITTTITIITTDVVA
jgi:hypothetical protein